MKAFRILTLSLSVVSLVVAADNPFNGTWKLNLSKSKLSGQTVSIDKKPAGGYRFDSQGFAYDFDLDGKEYPTPDGGTASWKATDPNTWAVTARMNGKVTQTVGIVLKDPGHLAVTFNIKKPDGSSVQESLDSTRVSGGPGISGKWRSGDVKGTPTTMGVNIDASGHITVTVPEGQTTCAGLLDGKDYVQKTAGVDTKIFLAFERTMANAITVTTKLDGKPIYIDKWTVSADGKTLTDGGSPTFVDEPVTAIFERQ